MLIICLLWLSLWSLSASRNINMHNHRGKKGSFFLSTILSDTNSMPFVCTTLLKGTSASFQDVTPSVSILPPYKTTRSYLFSRFSRPRILIGRLQGYFPDSESKNANRVQEISSLLAHRERLFLLGVWKAKLCKVTTMLNWKVSFKIGKGWLGRRTPHAASCSQLWEYMAKHMQKKWPRPRIGSSRRRLSAHQPSHSARVVIRPAKQATSTPYIFTHDGLFSNFEIDPNHWSGGFEMWLQISAYHNGLIPRWSCACNIPSGSLSLTLLACKRRRKGSLGFQTVDRCSSCLEIQASGNSAG